MTSSAYILYTESDLSTLERRKPPIPPRRRGKMFAKPSCVCFFPSTNKNNLITAWLIITDNNLP